MSPSVRREMTGFLQVFSERRFCRFGHRHFSGCGSGCCSRFRPCAKPSTGELEGVKPGSGGLPSVVGNGGTTTAPLRLVGLSNCMSASSARLIERKRGEATGAGPGNDDGTGDGRRTGRGVGTGAWSGRMMGGLSGTRAGAGAGMGARRGTREGTTTIAGLAGRNSGMGSGWGCWMGGLAGRWGRPRFPGSEGKLRPSWRRASCRARNSSLASSIQR